MAIVTTEKDKAKSDALAKLNALAPRSRVTAMVAAHQLSHSEWLRYRLRPACIFKFLNRSLASGISALFGGMTY
jgi:Ni/Fe-hydrogenase subunit HybB-like protein